MSPAAVNDVAVGHQSGALAVADADGATPVGFPLRAAEVPALAWLPLPRTTRRGRTMETTPTGSEPVTPRCWPSVEGNAR